MTPIFLDRFTVAAFAYLLTIGQPAIAQPAVCLPPEVPFELASDEALADYADLITDGYERYFKDITEYFNCIEASRAEVFSQARQVTKDYQEYLHRLDRLGLSEAGAATISSGNN